MKKDFQLASSRSPRWAFMEKFEVPSYDDDTNYLTRYRVIQTPWFAFYVHRFDGPDPRPTLHDHPFNFLSVVVRGGYVERRIEPITDDVNENHIIKFFNLVRKTDAHAIVKLLRVPTWTLLFVGRRTRDWGYLEPLPDGGYDWTRWDRHPHNEEFKAALARRSAK